MSDTIFETIKDSSRPLAEQVAEQIRQLIIDRHLTGGDKLPNEFELAEQLNVGRGTVREAVKLLVARNVLEIRRGRGTFVTQQTGVIHDPLGFAYMPDQARLSRELLDIRLNMEPWIASMAAQNATSEDIAELRRLCREVENLIHAKKNSLSKDEELHICIARCSQNRVAPKLLPVITYSVHLFGKLRGSRTHQDTIDTHRRIVDAIAAHDPDAAKASMHMHLMTNYDFIMEEQQLQAEGKFSERPEPPKRGRRRTKK
ncbi:MAG: FadR family transcriptional regulator [Clostridia bacterium]|nr:FadR family transcriptional regulator [Clostridia bacterium]